MAKNFYFSGIARSNFMRLLLTVLLAIFFVPSNVNAQAKANFGGTWALNESKSNIPEGGFRRPAKQLTVKQEGINLNVDRLETNRDGEESTQSSKYTLDGKECSNTRFRGGNNIVSKSILTWSSDAKVLTIATTNDYNGNVRKSSEIWKLTDAKTLSIASSYTDRDGNPLNANLVYDKK